MTTPRPRPSTHTPRSLRELGEQAKWSWLGDPGDAQATGVSLSSSAIEPGDIFVAVAGRSAHGATYVDQAIAAGAVAILTDPDGGMLLGTDPPIVPVAIGDNPRAALGSLARTLYDPGVALPPVLAVTGTNGKTSVVFYLDAIARAMGLTSALSNTHERRIGDQSVTTPLTTPEAPELQALLALAAERGVELMALEASAQAIERDRLDGLRVAVAGFTNLSHDHLEDFGDMDTYFRTKAALFSPRYSDTAVISLETPWGERLARETEIPAVTLGHREQDPTWVLDILERSVDGTSFRLTGPEGVIDTSIPSLGDHMVRNAALALVMVVEASYSLDAVSAAVGEQQGGIQRVVPGRIEKVSGQAPISVFVDAGRSPDAYQHTLSTVAEVTEGNLIVVCGTSGNRDRSKRAAMGEIAATIAAHVVVSDDDPRVEDPAQIRADVISGVTQVEGASFDEVPSQELAIRRAVAIAEPGDSIVWIGPGSQSYRDVGGQREPFSARHDAQLALVEAGYLDAAKPVAS